MSLRNTSTRWGSVSQLLHWVIVVLIIAQFVLAFAADDLPLGLRKLIVLARHKSFGITILGLAVVRLAWRSSSPGPELPPDLKPYERFLARLTHYGLYALLFLTPLVGWMMSSAKNYPVSWFNLIQLPDLVAPNEMLYKVLNELHGVLAWTLAAIAGLHAAAALRHHFVRKDPVLRRMLPFTNLALVIALLFAAPAARSAEWMTDPAKSSLNFTFTQAGAKNTGRFAKFDVAAEAPASDLAGGKLVVTIQMSSLDTQDKDRDSTLRGSDLFDVAKCPTAQFISTRLDPAGTGRLEASGSLTIRGVTRPVKLPLGVRSATESGQSVVYLTGTTPVHRLEFGVGQGEWKSTEWVGDEVGVSWSVRLVPKPHP